MKVFLIEETDREKVYLRRYRGGDAKPCAKSGHYCDGAFFVAEAAIKRTVDGCIAVRDDAPPASDPRWPLACDACGVPFAADDPRQLFGRTIYRRPDTGEEMLLKDAPPGAVWNAWWIAERRSARGCGYMVGPDGRSLVVRLPDGSDWMIDSRARNCTMPNDLDHFCWVRHGRPEDGTLHVDKNGRTCAAGAGSIDSGGWHGFLRGGELRRC